MAVEPMAPVVVGLDTSPASLYALDLGAEEALGRVTPLDVVYVHERPAGPLAEPPGALPRARALLAAATWRVRDDHPGLTVRGTFVLGEPVEVLLRHAVSASLVVLGHGGVAWRGLGLVATRVAGRSAAPVLVCRPFDRARVPGHPRPVLLAVDDLGGSESAVAFAFEEAALRGAPVHACHVDAGSGSAPRMLAEAVAGWSAKYPEVEVARVVVPAADVAGVLLDASHEAQLVVLGRGRPAGSEPVMLTEICRALLAGAGCSVAVVPHP